MIVWNLPYLNPSGHNEPVLEPIEEASLTDLVMVAGQKEHAESLCARNNDADLAAVLLFRTDPISPSPRLVDVWVVL